MNDFTNSNTLAHSINEELKHRFVARPYNFCQPDETIWWLVPSTDWPAYKHGKLFFDFREGKVPGGNGGVYCGFEVEKGVGRTAAEGFRDRPEVIMKENWLWSRFVNNIVKELPALPPEQLLTVSFGYEPPSDLRKDFQLGRASFSLTGDQRLRRLDGVSPPSGNGRHVVEYFEAHVATESMLEGFLAQLQRLPDLDWLWVTMYIGVVPAGVTVKELWARYLKPWTPWLI